MLNDSKTPSNFSTFSTSEDSDANPETVTKDGKNVKLTEGGIHWFLGTLIFINTLVGAGILNFPHSIHIAGGIIISIIVQVCLVSLIWSSICSMVWAAQRKGTVLYQDTIYEYLGGSGRVVCSCLMLVHCYLVTTMYLIAIGEQLSTGVKIAFSKTEANHWYMSNEAIIVVTAALIIFPWCMVKTIDKLHFASSLASATIVIVASIVVYEFFHLDHHNVEIKTRPDRLSDLILSVPAYALSYSFDLCAVAVYGRLRHRSVAGFLKASGCAIAVVFVFYNVFAGFAYLTFGSKIRANFMTNYAQKEHEGKWVITFAEIAYSAKLCLEYPIYQYLGWTAFRSLLGYTASDEVKDRWWTSILWLLTTITFSIFARSISDVIPLISVVVLHFQFTFPGLVLYIAIGQCHDYESTSRTKFLVVRVFSVLLMVVGCLLSFVILFFYLQPKNV